jgi:hypothetical protein
MVLLEKKYYLFKYMGKRVVHPGKPDPRPIPTPHLALLLEFPPLVQYPYKVVLVLVGIGPASDPSCAD